MEQETKIQSKKIIGDKALFIEAALNLIPYAGGFLATYFGEIRNERIKERMNNYFKYFSEKLKELDEHKIDYNYLKSEEFAELFLQGAEQAAKSTTEQRIKRFANILANNILIGTNTRQRTQSIMSFVDRLADLDAFVLVSYGHPGEYSMRANKKDVICMYVHQLAEYLGIDKPNREDIIESVIYMDNLGLTWINENNPSAGSEKGDNLILKEFSSFRTPLGNEVVKVVTPPGFFRRKDTVGRFSKWPREVVNDNFKNTISF